MNIKKEIFSILKIISLCLLLIIISCKPPASERVASSGIGPGEQYIKIATFNIYRWGQTENDEKNYEKLAELIKDFDLIAIQEVMPQYGEERIPNLIEKLGEDYQYFITPKTGTASYSERYAFIFKEYISLKKDSGTFIIENPMNNQFYNRVPYMAYFKAGNFDFWLINVHLLWGSDEEDRTRETSHLADWLKSFTPADEEKDYIIVGDFNRYGSGFKSFDEFLFEGWDNHYRILTIEPASLLKTNCAKTVHKTYDNIFISLGAIYEFGEEKAIIDETIGVIPWDTWRYWNDLFTYDLSVTEFRKIISDHRPVWAKFEIWKFDDD